MVTVGAVRRACACARSVGASVGVGVGVSAPGRAWACVRLRIILRLQAAKKQAEDAAAALREASGQGGAQGGAGAREAWPEVGGAPTLEPGFPQSR